MGQEEKNRHSMIFHIIDFLILSISYKKVSACVEKSVEISN
jgi:hypothetical protein